MRFSVSISATLGKAAATIANSLKRRRDDIDDEDPHDQERRKRAAISDVATSEVVHRFTVDSHPAPAVAEHESGLSPGGWDEFGLSAFSSSASSYPAIRSPQAHTRESG
ncbi:unnamed protein product [Tilletia controversa]|uniref:Uncharacterized protein n=1 Tax=Tilletia caries TaxID=13290 RepID=A0ABN7J9L8_9BASI|nr:unnamed protein product [Tilletia controversa]CAD6957369.1 unnamed protein product [Tilletia controversa]CAD6958470.1 unnamed protein product [Tilletia caries]CAD6968964.1 unnamed protein product [Tilletia controversa]CAD7067324.1 unnamed protein product [Tilletia caries]